MIRTILEYLLAGAFFASVVSFGTALALSPIYTTIKGWHERSDLENTLRVAGAGLGLLIGAGIVLNAIGKGLFLA